MNYKSAVTYVRRLAICDIQAWRYLSYQAKMKLLGIDLAWSTVEQNGLTHERSHWHSSSGGPDLETLLNTLPIHRTDAVVDLGCGKGGAMMSLARYPFARVDGVEISPRLADVAVKNLERIHVTNARVFCADAADFQALDAYTYIYMYNPFPELVMKTVVRNLAESLCRCHRTLTLIYRNPIFESVVLTSGFGKVKHTEQHHPDYPSFAVYLAN